VLLLEDAEHALGQRRGARLGAVAGGDGPGAALAVVEGDELADVEEVGLGEERIGAEAVGDLLAPARGSPAEVADEAAAERRQVRRPLRCDGRERRPQRVERRLGQLRQPGERAAEALAVADGEPRRGRGAVARAAADADIAVAAERALEEERVASGRLLLVEETEDAEWRQQITGQLYRCRAGGRARSKAGSGSGSSWRGL
jgi:hypothetical protein